ncbi:AMP-dependent synthetase/ligase [Penicillium riverlandense]|uniref:AMP-dependent synthetase/ligase n=1 Tax=Penicillium riverlandense TaxID=1903569 RepID=UPI002547B7AF|nr:AMP-dependent synthetase/ligase [Penicillium riverlandense]KAJ5815263.1 AMP-dependent synthetase/ligase [Penicillium riverlandense]
MDRYTQFPVSDGEAVAPAVVPWQLDELFLPSDVYVRSWASLLHAFTTDEHPVFRLNTEPVKVDLSTRTIQPAVLDAASDASERHTAVIIEAGPSSTHAPASGALTWFLDPTTQSGVLHSTIVDDSFLYQLGRQLKQFVQKQAAQMGIQVKLSANELPKMSILNPSPSLLPGSQLLHQLVALTGSGSNNAIEFLAADGQIRSLTYHALDALSTTLAAEITSSLASADDSRKRVVPVLLPQSVELYISWLAILKAGAAFCPLNTDAPLDRVDFIVQDVAASVVVTQGSLASRVPQDGHLAVITVDDLKTKDSIITIEPWKKISSSDLAYVMYTSGSTGHPKGVGISHLAVTQSLLAHNDLIPPFRRFLQFASPTFDVSVFEVFFPLMRGATLIGAEREHMLLDISHVMTEMKVEAAELTPTVAGELLRTRAAAPSLQVLLTIGEMLSRHVVDEFGHSPNSPGILHGMYGPTEAAIHCTAATHFQANARVNLIGKPFKTVSAYIVSLDIEDKSLSEMLQPLPWGQIGELVVGGFQLADGYLNRPEENAKAFIDHPLHGRLYRTGDKARMLPTGDIECLGRISSGQVKLRGQRIELGEIEHVICRAPNVRAAVAIVSNGSLIAFVLVDGESTVDSVLRDVCRQWLPRFMVPGEFVLVNQLPQLPSGKIDRKALEVDFAQHRSTTQSVDQPPFRDATEETIVSAITDVLGTRPSQTESLISAGLDSLAAIRLASHLLSAGIRLHVWNLLEADSVDGIWLLAKELETSQPPEDMNDSVQRISQLVAEAGAARIETLGLGLQVTAVKACSHIQQAMLLETARNMKAYCNWVELDFDSSISLESAKDAFIRLTQHNDILKAGFVEIGLKDQSYGRFTWKSLDEHFFQTCNELDFDVSLGAEHDLLHPFRIQFKTEHDKLRVLVHIHHALYDGWSWQLMLKDLQSILKGEELPSRPAYDIVTDFFVEYKMRGSTTESSLFWRDQLQGFSPSAFPNFHGQDRILPGTEEATRVLDISVSKLNEVSQLLRVSRQSVFQAAFCYLLSSYQGTGDVVFGTVSSGRTLPIKGIEAVLGPCIRILPTRMNIDKMQRITDLLLAIQNMNRKSLEHGSLPLQDIKKASGINPSRSLFDSALVWQESIWAGKHQDTFFQEVAAAEFLEFALLLEFEPREDHICAKATYQRSILPREQAEILLEQIDCVASVLIDSPDLPISDICCHFPSSVLSMHNADFETQVNFPGIASGVELISSVDPSRLAVEHLLSKEPDSVDVEVQAITYCQLNTKANRLAHHFLQLGATSTDLIAVSLEKCPSLYISLLAVAKIGAGVVPLDVRASSQALQTILETTNFRFCIVDSQTEHRYYWGAQSSVQIVRADEPLDGYPDRNPPTPNEEFNVAYIETTSTSDDPTTLLSISHRNVQSSFYALEDSYPSFPGSRMLQASSPVFGASIFETFFAWHMGMTLCSTSDDYIMRNTQQTIEKLGITHLHLTPAMASRIRPQDVPSVQYLFISSEELTAKVHRDWAGRGLCQGYSARELTYSCTLCPEVEPSTLVLNVGRPLRNTSAMVVADRKTFTLLPRGAVGELCIGGEQVGQRLSNSEISRAGGIIEHPDFGRIYRTGDFGRFLPDGSLVLTPRQDHGPRFALSEIDNALLSLEKVKDSVSMILRSPNFNQQQLVTFWISSQGVQELRDTERLKTVISSLFKELNMKLRPHMVPSLLFPVDEIPMTDSKKTDRVKLQQQIDKVKPEDLQSFSSTAGFDGTDDGFTGPEKTIAAALSAVTGTHLHNIRSTTSFYSLGLESLSAISFSRKLWESGCSRLSVSTILRHDSVAQLAAVISEMQKKHQTHKSSLHGSTTVLDESFVLQVKTEFDVLGRSVQHVYPCTPLQEAMLAAGSSGNHSAYFNHLLIRVHTDHHGLRTAWDQMLQRHEIFRTCFKPTNDKRFAYAQVVLDYANLPWSEVETSSHDLNQEIDKQKADFQGRSPVDGELPYSLTLLTDSTTQKTYLLLSIHHALYDGEGITQLLHELQLSLSGREPSPRTPFRQFVEYMTSVDSGVSDAYWDKYLSGLSPTLLSARQNDKGLGEESASQQIHMTLNTSLESLKQSCRNLSVTPLNVFHGAWARLLSLYAGSSDVCFGNVFSCRTLPLEGVDRIVGPCFNTLPVRIKVPSTATNGDIIKLAQKSNTDILPHQLSPLRRIQKRILTNGTRLFDTLVILQNGSPKLDSHVWELLCDEGNMGFPLVCEIVPDEVDNDVRICLHFQTTHISQNSATQIAEDFVALVNHTTRYPSAQVSDKQLLNAKIPQLFVHSTTQSNKFIEFASTTPRIPRQWSYQEEAIRDILCKFSEFDNDGVTQETTIFQLGLDSINAVQLAATLRRMGYRISAGELLESASIENIASLLNSAEKSAKDGEFDFSSFETQYLDTVCEQLHIPQDRVQSLRPCTPVQNGMLAMFNNSDGAMYFNKMALKSSRPLDRTLLKKAWSQAMARHEMLRTGFVQLRDQQYPFAMITYHQSIGIPWHETLHCDAQLTENEILKNLHRPPWSIAVECSDIITTMHFSALHAIYDAQSLASVFADVATMYEGKDLSVPLSITETLGPILVESRKQSETTQEFWQSLAPEVQACKFPDLHPTRVEKRNILENSIECSLPQNALNDVCRKLGVTLQAAGQATWARLLAAYTGESNTVFGTVLSGRNLSAASWEAVFPCLVTVPMPLRVEGTNRELLDRTLKRNVSLVKNQFTPLSHIQRWMGSDEPLFDTLFVYQKFASVTERPEAWEVVDEVTKIDYPVSIELIPQSTELEIRLSYRSDIVPREQAQMILKQYDKLLENTLFLPDSSCGNYSSIGRDLLSITSAKEVRIESPVSLLHQFVEKNAEKTPERIAFEFVSGFSGDVLQKRTWSYSELNESGNRIARFLQAKGATPGSMIAICFDKCPEASMAILGILKSGCAYVAIDPTAPVSRKQFILEDSSSMFLLCNSSKRTEVEGLSDVDIQFLDEPGLLDGIPSAQPLLPREIQPDDTCYCLYTSGTTGTPKGCEITHDNTVQAMLAFQRLFAPHWDDHSRWLQFASFHFDVSVLEQFWSWSVGICVTSCPRDLLFEDLPGTIQKLQITHIDLTPSLARLVHPAEVPSLCRGVFITGGEQLKQEILDAWGEYGVIYNGYGPTEVTIGCTMLPRMSANDKASNIGPQFDNVGSYVFRPDTTTPVLRGSIGELCVSGPLVGKGYLNRAELTMDRFQVVPEHQDRIYRTGDLVRILYDGSFQFLGRIDDQVKLRGQRLEIGEINEVIKQSTPEVNEVTTLVIKHPKHSKDQLISFVTETTADKKNSHSVEVRASEADSTMLSVIKTACHTHLPGYMVPSHVIPMTRFPLSANNKADTKLLKSIYQELPLEEIQKLTALGADRDTDNSQQQKIISVLSELLGSSDLTISSWSSIYELGLDSISVIAFSRSLREAGFSQAQPSLIMKHPTIAGMSSAFQMSTAPTVLPDSLHKRAKQGIEAFVHKNTHLVLENIGILDTEIERIAPCTPLQEGIIYHFLSSNTSLYCSSFTFELEDSFDLQKLQSSWSHAQQEVQMLRARFSPSPDGYAQAILKRDRLPWFYATVPQEEDINRFLEQRHQQWVWGLDGLSTNLWEVGVVGLSGKWIMCLNIFHALYDGHSMGLLLSLVARHYFGQSQSVERPPNFLDMLHLGPFCRDPSAETFWRKHLAACENRVLTESDHENSPSTVYGMRINTTEHVDHLRRSLNVTEQAVLHACWLLTLYQHYSFVPPLGIVASGRVIDVAGIDNVVGPFFNTIPSNIQLRGLDYWSDIALKCHEYHVSTLQYQHTPLRDIVKWLGKHSEGKLFDSLFVFQREPNDGQAFTEHLWRPLDSEAQHEYPLAFEITRHGNESLTGTLAAKSHVLSPDAAEQVLSSFERILSDFANNPSRRLPQINDAHHENHPQKIGGMKKPRVAVKRPVVDGPEFQWTPQACTIREAIATLAGVEHQSVSEDMSIFEVGLDSIDAIKLSSLLSKSGIKLPVSTIMRHRTVKTMVGQLLEPNHRTQNGTYPLLGQMEISLTGFLEREGLLPQDFCRILPATPIQEAMVAEMIASGYKHYYNHEILQLEPHVDLLRLQEAWEATVRAHPILRTSFVEVWDPEISTSYAQVVHSEGNLDFQIVHLHGVSVNTIIETHRSRATTDLAHRPLVTVTVAVDGDTRYFVLSIAHALYDGWSINLLHEDVARCYAGDVCNRPSSDSILEQIVSSSDDRAFRFWRATLSNYSPVAFPPSENAGKDEDVVHRAEEPLSVPLRKAEAFCRRHGITMQALLVSCWSLVLAGYVKKLDVVFGLVLSGRNVAGSEHVIFPTMNTVAMRVVLHGTRLELVRYVQEALLEMSDHQHFSLRRARPDTGRLQLFDTLFIYQKRPIESTAQGPKLYTSIGGVSDVEYPICAEVEGVGESLVGRVACRETVLGEKDTLKLVGQMAHTLSSIVDDPNQQTVDFTREGLSICRGPVFQEISAGNMDVVDAWSQAPHSTEWSPLESKIRNVLSTVAGVPEVSIDKSATIFQLGLDSISAIKVVALLKKQSVKLAVSDILKAGTIDGMARAANSARTELTTAEISGALCSSLSGVDVKALLQSYGVDPRLVQSTFPTTAGQSYFLSMHAQNQDVFYPEFYYLASRELSEERLERAWARLIDQMPILRTVFIPARDLPRLPYVQAVLRSVQNPVVWHQKVHNRMISSKTQRGLGSVPVALHACHTSQGTALVLQIHHALYDAVSLPSMIDRLATLYRQGEEQEPHPGFVDISQFVAFQLVHSPVDIRRQFWKKYLGQYSTNKTAVPQKSKFGVIHQYYRPGLVSNMTRLEIAAKRQGLSVQSIFLAMYARVHARIFVHDEKDRQSLIVGLYLANRSYAAEGLSELVAPTVNIVPLRLDGRATRNDTCLFAAARKIQNDVNEISMVDHAGVSLGEIAEWTGVRIDTCINFLRLPELADTSGHTEEGKNVVFKAIPGEELERPRDSSPGVCHHARTNGDIATAPPPTPTRGLDSNALAVIQDVYRPTLDVEAAVRDGRLDFGLFGPDSRLDSTTADRIIEEVRQEISALVDTPGLAM